MLANFSERGFGGNEEIETVGQIKRAGPKPRALISSLQMRSNEEQRGWNISRSFAAGRIAG